MITNKDIQKKLIKALDGRQKCSLCGESIPKEVDRLSFGYKTRFGHSYIRLCGLCLIRASNQVDKKSLKEWAKKIVVSLI